MARRDSYLSTFLGALGDVGQAGKTIAANRQATVDNAQNAKRIAIDEAQNQREADKFAIEKPGLELSQKLKSAEYEKDLKKNALESSMNATNAELAGIREIPLGVRNDLTENALSQKVMDQYDQLSVKPAGTSWLARQDVRTKAQQDAETHASNLETAKVNRERGNFQLGGTSDGNFTVLDTRKGNLTNTGVPKDAPPPKVGHDPAFDALPTEQKEQVKILAQSMGKRQLAVNELEAGLKEFQAAKTDNDKQRIGRGMLKVLNSPENPDAIGAEEEKGIGNALRFQKLNLLGPGQFVGTDFPGFETQVQAKIDIMKAAAEKNSKNIDGIYGRVSPTTGGGQGQQSDDMLTQAQTILGDKEATPAEKKAAQDYIDRQQAKINQQQPRAR